MKSLYKIFIVLSLCFFAASVNAEPTARVYNYNIKKNVYLAEKLASGEPILYCSYVSEDGLKIISKEDFEDYIKLVFKIWTAYPAKVIRQSGREKEFGPVLEKLETAPNLIALKNCDFSKYPKKYLTHLNPVPEVISAPGADISFFYEDVFFAKIHSLDKIPPHYSFNPVPHIVIPTRFADIYSKSKKLSQLKNDILQTPNHEYVKMAALLDELESFIKNFRGSYKNILYAMLHETGHSIGLADQLESSLDNADVIYSTVNPRKSIMDNWTQTLTCDDVDGIIMLFDDALKIKRTDFGSFCKDGIRFSEGKESFEGEKTNTYNPGYNSMSRTYSGDTKDTGVYYFESSTYVNTESKESRKLIEENFDQKAMPKNLGGFQKLSGNMRIVDFNNPENRVPIGRHEAVITLGPMAFHKQVLIEEYDNNGNILYYTLEIYKEGKLVKKKSKVFSKEKPEMKLPK